jgi:hypothetical protein
VIAEPGALRDQVAGLYILSLCNILHKLLALLLL